jgi:hypothetical protein
MDLQSTMGTISQATKQMFTGMTDEMQMCIQNCTLCYQTCSQLIAHCLEKGGEQARKEHIQILIDCAEACAVSADFMLRKSDLHSRTCGVCAEACLACAESCEAIADDVMMKNCIEVCRRCADSCQKMAKIQ